MTLVNAGLDLSERQVMVTGCPSTTGDGVVTDTVGLSTIVTQLIKNNSKKVYEN